jgi:AraC-like ligand binding domain
MRHAIVTRNDPKRGVSVSTLARDYPSGSHVEPHAHGSDQLIYASRGVMQVSSGPRLWVLPPHFGLWIPAGTLHEIRMAESVSVRTLYLRPGLAGLDPACTVLHVRPLLRELIFEVVRVGHLRTASRIECALGELLMAELRRASVVPTVVALPSECRALRVAQTVMGDLRLQATLQSMCAAVGTS